METDTPKNRRNADRVDGQNVLRVYSDLTRSREPSRTVSISLPSSCWTRHGEDDTRTHHRLIHSSVCPGKTKRKQQQKNNRYQSWTRRALPAHFNKPLWKFRYFFLQWRCAQIVPFYPRRGRGGGVPFGALFLDTCLPGVRFCKVHSGNAEVTHVRLGNVYACI